MIKIIQTIIALYGIKNLKFAKIREIVRPVLADRGLQSKTAKDAIGANARMMMMTYLSN